MSSSYRIALNSWLSSLDVSGGLILDLGGSQEKIPRHVASFKADQYIIADLPEPHADSPKPDVILDLNEPIHNKSINKGLCKYEGKADIVFCLEVLDYIHDPLTAFKTMAFLLKNGGTLYVSSGLFYPTHNPIQDDCLRYTEFGIRKLAEKSGLKVLEMIPRRPDTNAIEMLWRSERLRAAKHYDHNTLGFITELTK